MMVELTIGPILFHWPAEQKRDFYFRIADEAPIDTVYIGEVICSKRSPFFEPYYEEISKRLQNAGKKVVFSSLAEVMIPRERKMTEGMCSLDAYEIEANDSSALYHLRGRSHRIGPFFNVYNEDTMGFLASKGAKHFTLPQELPATALSNLARKARQLDVTIEVQVYGRVGLALSARCYHARAHNRVKDNCQFVCEEDPDGMTLNTINGTPFLSINGIQTLSYHCLTLLNELDDMKRMGIHAFRLSPHNHDMIKTSCLYRDVLDNKLSPKEALSELKKNGLQVPFSNGFYHGEDGYRWIKSA
ncbi:MAG: U32 family peptidase [Alphaproteobacteria bacterium]|nr:U32 family peptidase [Alphaproteobacteria bacterium]